MPILSFQRKYLKKAPWVSQHSLTKQREYMTKAGCWLCLRVFRKVEEGQAVCVCISEEMERFFCDYMRSKTSYPRLSPLLFWQCRGTNPDASSLRHRAALKTEMAHISDQSCYLTQGDVTPTSTKNWQFMTQTFQRHIKGLKRNLILGLGKKEKKKRAMFLLKAFFKEAEL